MASKRRIRRLACTGKVRYETQPLAMFARSRMAYGKELSAYKCKFCGGWHLGHAPDKMKRKLKRRHG